MESFLLIQTMLPDDASPDEVESNVETLRAARSIGLVVEGLGYSVFERVVPLRMVDNLVGGNIRVIWRKLRRYVEFERDRGGSQKTFEWFQLLAEQLERYKQGKTSLQMGLTKPFATGKCRCEWGDGSPQQPKCAFPVRAKVR